MIKYPDWAYSIGEMMHNNAYDREAGDGAAQVESFADCAMDFVMEHITEIVDWAFEAHCHYEWQAHQLCSYIKGLPPESVPESVRKVAEAQP
jgi:hypothetical protein